MNEEALIGAINRLDAALTPTLSLDESKWCGYVSYDTKRFLDGLSFLQRFSCNTFLDVGCGIGVKMLLAEQLGLRASGVEVRPEYAVVARLLCPTALIREQDAMTDTEFDADIVFSYQIMATTPDQDRLDALMVAQAPRVLWLPYRQVASSAWRKIADGMWERN